MQSQALTLHSALALLAWRYALTLLTAQKHTLEPDAALAQKCAICMLSESLMGHALRSAGHQALPALLRRPAKGLGAAMGAYDP